MFKDMILYLDTSCDHSIVMLLRKTEILSHRTNSLQKEHASVLNMHIAEVLQEANCLWDQLAGVVVMNGPGSYTGLRLSLATAKGLCYAHQIPLYLFNKLDLIMYATPIPQRGELNGIAIKARAGEYFWAEYDYHGNCVVSPCVANLESIQIKNGAFKLFCIDSDPDIDFMCSEKVTIGTNTIALFVNEIVLKLSPANLFLSEPFYLKNVYLTK